MKRLIGTTLFGLLSVGLISSLVYAQSTASSSSATAAVSPDLMVGPGEKLVLQLDTPLHTGSTRNGDRAYFKTSDEVMVGGDVAIPRGSEVRATVTHVRRPGRLAGRAEMRLRFDDVRLPDGTILPLEASVVRAGYTDIKTSKEGGQSLKGDGGNGSSLTIVGQGGHARSYLRCHPRRRKRRPLRWCCRSRHWAGHYHDATRARSRPPQRHAFRAEV